MKKSTKSLSLGAALLASLPICALPVLAQQAVGSVQSGASAQAAGTSVNQNQNTDVSAAAGRRSGTQAGGVADGSAMVQTEGTGGTTADPSAQSAAAMMSVSGELLGQLDSKSAKVGDTVIVKTTGSARTAEGTAIPKGSRLVGHVTDVRAHAKGSPESILAVQFDRAEMKGGQSVSIHSVIESISPSASALSSSALDSDDSFGSIGGMRSSGGGRAAGGLTGGPLSGGSALAGGAGGIVGSATGTQGANGGAGSSNLASAGDGAVSATARASANTSAAAAGSLQSAAAAGGALGAHTTAIPGLMLAGDATGATSGTLSASRKNVHLDSGTRMVLGVSSATTR